MKPRQWFHFNRRDATPVPQSIDSATKARYTKLHQVIGSDFLRVLDLMAECSLQRRHR